MNKVGGTLNSGRTKIECDKLNSVGGEYYSYFLIIVSLAGLVGFVLLLPSISRFFTWREM